VKHRGSQSIAEGVPRTCDKEIQEMNSSNTNASQEPTFHFLKSGRYSPGRQGCLNGTQMRERRTLVPPDSPTLRRQNVRKSPSRFEF